MSQRVTRIEIAEAIGHAFGEGGATRGEIIEATSTTNRQEIVEILRGLPDRRYARLNELWEVLHDIPVGV